MIRALLFDFDGTVIDTESIDLRTWHEVFEAHGVTVPVERFALRIGDGARVAEGWTTHACVDAHTLRPTRLPQWIVDAIARAES